MSGVLHCKDWDRFQHYKHRRPPWIKLYRSLLDHREYQDLDDAAARLLFDVWLIASESDGCLPFDSALLAWRVRRPQDVIRVSLQVLIAAGFLTAEGQDASGTLAPRVHDATPEKSRVETEITTRPAARAETTTAPPNGDFTFGAIMALVRQYLYVPNGKAPAHWDEQRDRSILKQILKAHRPGDVAIAIEGLAIVRDHPGVFADEVDWLRPNTKATLRALYNTKSGVLPMFAIATQAYWKRANTRPAQADRNAPVAIGDVLQRAIHKSTG